MMAAQAVLQQQFGRRAVGAASCALGDSVVVMGGLAYDGLYERSALSSDLSVWRADSGWSYPRLPPGGPAPKPRAGHTCCAHEGRMVVFGGYDASAIKLGDVWELLTAGSASLLELELGVEAVLSAASREAELASRQKAGGKQKGAQEELQPLPIFKPARFRAALEAALELPAEAIRVSEPAEAADAPGRVHLKVGIEPLLAVGMRAYGVDGDALAGAVLLAMRDRLLAAGVPEAAAAAEAAAEPKDKKGDKGKPAAPAKGAAAAAAPAEQPGDAGRPAPPNVGYAIKSWALHETSVAVPGTLSWRECVPSDTGVSVAPRSGHSADVHEGAMWVFGGAGSGGALAALETLDLRTLEWAAPSVAGKPPAARFSHASCVLGAAEGAVPLLVICGGVGKERLLGDCCVLDLSAKAWCALELEAEAPAAFPTHAAWHAMSASGRRAIVFGGVGGTDEALGSLASLHFEKVEEAQPAQTAKEAKAAKGDAAAAQGGGKYRVHTTRFELPEGADVPSPRFSHCVAPLPSTIAQPDDEPARVLVFGGTTATSALEDCWVVAVPPHPARQAAPATEPAEAPV